MENNNQQPENNEQQVSPKQASSEEEMKAWFKEQYKKVKMVMPLLTLITSIVSIVLSAQLARQTAIISKNQLETAKSASANQAVSMIYSLNQFTSRLMNDNADVFEYFETFPESDENRAENIAKEEEDNEKRTARLKKREEILKAKFEKEKFDEKRLARLWGTAEALADAFDFTYQSRCHLNAKDWEGWWEYMCSQWDESFIFRSFIKQRKKWYQVYEVLDPKFGMREKIKRREYPEPCPKS